MSSGPSTEKIAISEMGQVALPRAEKNSHEEQHLEHVRTSSLNLEYNEDEEEPEIRARTYVALAAMFLLNLVQVVALQGPPAVVGSNYDQAPKTELIIICSSITLAQISIIKLLKHGSPTLFRSSKL